MAKVEVNPGACGLMTKIESTSEDMMNATIQIQSDCPYINQMAAEIETVDGMKECFCKYGEGKIGIAAKKYCKHAACPVPSAIVKSVELACGFALPKDVEIRIEK